MSMDSPPSEQQSNGWRYFPCVVFFIAVIILFIGGTAALLYRVFSQYSGVTNIWLLGCGAPFLFGVLGLITIYTLYSRFGRPLRQIFNAIDSVADGDLSVRVPDDNSPQFGELIKRFNKMVGDLARAEQQRRNLTADIAHELRTPLHIIQGNLEGVIDGVYQPTAEHINATLDETRLLTRLVNDLQTLSLAETGQLPLHPTRFLLADLMQDLTSSFSAQAALLDIDLKTSLTDPNLELTADYDRLNQVLSNLVSNALRHTPTGGAVSLDARSKEGKDGKSNLELTVRDTGKGILAEELPFIFDRFWRGDKSRSDRTHTGLGLAITRQLVHAHGGTIEVQSEAGKGTKFRIELPLTE